MKKQIAKPVQAAMPAGDSDPPGSTGGRSWWWLLLFPLFGLLVYGAVFTGGGLLMTTDDGIGVLAMRRSAMPATFLGCWNDSILAGALELLNFNWTNLWLWLLPLKSFANWIHAIDLAAASILLAIAMRVRGLSPVAAVVAAFTSFWVGSTFFLTFAGHLGKFGLLPFVAGFLCCWELSRGGRRVLWAFVAGAALGGAYLEQADVAIFFTLPLGCYVLMTLFQANRDRLVRAILPLAVFGVGFVLLAAHPMLTNYLEYATKGPGSAKSDPVEAWNYATQWSWPPDETIEWVAPGYMGWKTGDMNGPYWGKLGRSPGWQPANGLGGSNFKLETFYMGAVPLALALFALVLAIARRTRQPGDRTEIIFWSAVAFVTFLLGLGKFFPLYRGFFALPGMSSIRNPVKFMQVTQVALGILAAYGIDWLLKAGLNAAREQCLRIFRWIVLGVAIIFLLAGFSAAAGESARASAFATQGWGQIAPTMVAVQVAALLRAAGMCFLAWALLLLLPRATGAWLARRNQIAWGALALIGLDQWMVSRHYIEVVKADEFIGRNAVVDYLKTNLQSQRAYLLSQESFYGHWLTYLFPYHQIPTFNVTQIRMPEDYQRFLTTVGRGAPDRLWRQFAVGQLMGPAQAWPQLQQLAGLKDGLEIGMTFNVVPQGAGVTVLPGSATQPGGQMIARVKTPAPRYALLGGWKLAPDDEVLRDLADPAKPLFVEAALAPDAKIPPAPSGGAGIAGTVEVVRYRSGAVTLKTQCDKPSVLRASERYTSQWKAWLDGQPVELMRCDFLFQGVFVPPGEHVVELKYAPPAFTLWFQFAGMALAALAMLTALVQGMRRKQEPAAA